VPFVAGKTDGLILFAHCRAIDAAVPGPDRRRVFKNLRFHVIGNRFVQTHDKKPKRRLFELLKEQGMQMNQQVKFFSDGGVDIRDMQLYLNPEAEHYLDWFHVTMRITVMGQYA
jgi:hypothetical protein